MKNIELMCGYWLEVEGTHCGNITLKHSEPSKNKPGQTVETTDGYYSTFGGALLAFRRKAIKRHLSKQENLSLGQAIEQVKALDAAMRALIIDTGLDCGATQLV